MYGDFFESLRPLYDQLRLQLGMLPGDYEFGDPSKVAGPSLRVGSTVKIVFRDTDDVHEGVVFTLPGLEPNDVWMGGVIQVARPYFEGDKDCPGPIWVTVDQALKNEQIERIVVKH